MVKWVKRHTLRWYSHTESYSYMLNPHWPFTLWWMDITVISSFPDRHRLLKQQKQFSILNMKILLSFYCIKKTSAFTVFLMVEFMFCKDVCTKVSQTYDWTQWECKHFSPSIWWLGIPILVPYNPKSKPISFSSLEV